MKKISCFPAGLPIRCAFHSKVFYDTVADPGFLDEGGGGGASLDRGRQVRWHRCLDRNEKKYDLGLACPK